MTEFILEYGMPLVSAVILILGGMYVPAVRKILLVMFRALLTENVIKRIVIYLLENLVKSTKNKLDDKILEEIKKSLNE
jgi:hypothetical protein